MTCKYCGREVPESEFSKSNRCKCKACHNAACSRRCKLLWATNPVYRKKEAERQRRRWHNNAEYRERRKQQQREREHSEEYKARQREKYRARVEAKRALLRRQVCANCWLFPCFTGIETMSSNLALTCRKWHNKNMI